MITQTLSRPAVATLPGWGCWAAWTLATVYGSVASLLILFGFHVPLVSGEAIGAIHWSIIVMVIVSLAQWPILYRYLPALNARQWLGANVLGSITGFFAGWICDFAVDLILRRTFMPNSAIDYSLRDSATLVAGGAGAGAVLAIVQWLALRPYLHGRTRWIYATATAWMITGLVVMIMQRWQYPMLLSLREHLSQTTGLSIDIVSAVILGVVGGLLVGTITGLALVALVRARFRERE